MIRQNSPDAQVGIALNVNFSQPASKSGNDHQAFQYEYGLWTRWFLDPLYGRKYPADLVEYAIQTQRLPPGGLDFVQEGDLAAIAAPADFLGVNYYTRQLSGNQDVPSDGDHASIASQIQTGERQEMENWEVYPDGLFNVLAWIYFEYQPRAFFITENGASWSDEPDEQGVVKDFRRISFLKRHFAAAHRAIQIGVPLKGYLVWSLMDNLEWGYGFSKRFGLIWVDFNTQQRILKDSARWYAQVIAENGFDLSADPGTPLAQEKS